MGVHSVTSSYLGPLLSSCAEGLIRAMATKNMPTTTHQEATARLATLLGRSLGLAGTRLDRLRVAARLHDIGKLAVPVDLLEDPRPLDLVERHALRAHVIMGAQMLRHAGFPADLCTLVECHHERLDGSGYPYGLVGDEITFDARILAVADHVDAQLSHCPHRPAHDLAHVRRVLPRGRDRLFDRRVVDAALEIFDDRDVDLRPMRVDDDSYSVSA